MATVLIVDDDPSHLKIYSWIVERGGFRSVPVLAWGSTLDLPQSETVDIALLDYRLGGITAAEAVRQVKATYPSAHILILSDMMYMPDDVADHASAFVRKGHPDQLLETLCSFVKPAPQGELPPAEPAA